MLKDAVPVETLSRALVIKLRHHGDVLLSAPVLSALKAAAPQLEIDALVYDDTAPMLAGHPALAQLHTVGRKWKGLGVLARLSAEWALYRALRARGYDLIVHLSEQPRGAWLARHLGARWSVAPAMRERGRFWKRSFTHFYALPRNGRRHQVELNLDALRRIGVQPTEAERRVRIEAGVEAACSATALLEAQGLQLGNYIHLHPASRWKFKCWPAQSTAALIDRLSQDPAWQGRIVLTAAPDPAELALVQDIVSRTRAPLVNLAGRLSLKELVAVIGGARLSVCVDSMPMHVASATGTPVVALFGPSGEHEWGPWMVPHEVVTSTHACRPCGNDGCGGGKVSECLVRLGVEAVHGAARRLLDAPRSAQE